MHPDYEKLKLVAGLQPISIGSKNVVSRTPPFKWPKDAQNEAFSTTETSFSGWCSASGILVAAGWASLAAGFLKEPTRKGHSAHGKPNMCERH